MSVESEILRIQRNVADAYTAVAEMGGNIPVAAELNSGNLAAAVRSIPTTAAAGGESAFQRIMTRGLL